jgi:hypothetical protein
MNGKIIVAGGAADPRLAELDRLGSQPLSVEAARRAAALLAEMEREPVPAHKRGKARFTAHALGRFTDALPNPTEIYAARRKAEEEARAAERPAAAPATANAGSKPRTIADIDVEAIYASRARAMGRR